MSNAKIQFRLPEDPRDAAMRQAAESGIVRLSLFGSTARNEARAESDIDLVAAFDNAQGLSLLDIIGIENRLVDILGQPVDLIEEGTFRPRARRSVSRESVRAF